MSTKPQAHTPGPWQLEAGRSFKTASGEFYITYGKDRFGNPLFRDFCELDANARLIAAAPDLLEAAEAALVRLDAYFRYSKSYEVGLLCKPAEDLRAAIAKAKGGAA